MPRLSARHRQTGQVMTEYLIAGVVLSGLLFIASYLVRGAIHYQNRYETLLADVPPQQVPPLANPKAVIVDDWDSESTFVADESQWENVPGAAQPPQLGPEKTVLKVNHEDLIGRKIWYLSKDGNLTVRWTEDGLPELPSSQWIKLGSSSSSNSNVIEIDWPSAAFPDSGHYRFELLYKNQTDQPYPMALSVDDAPQADFTMSPEADADAGGMLREQSPLIALSGGSHHLTLTSAKSLPAPRPAPVRLTFWREEPGQAGDLEPGDFGLANLTGSGNVPGQPGSSVPPPLGGTTPASVANPDLAETLTDQIDVPANASQCVDFFNQNLFSAGRPSSVQVIEHYQVRIDYVRPSPPPGAKVDPPPTTSPPPPLPSAHMESRATSSVGATGDMIQAACSGAASGQLSTQWSYGVAGNDQLSLNIDRTGPPQTETQVWSGP